MKLPRRFSIHPDRQRGFTLIEVLVAMALIAIVIPIAMRGISLSLSLESEARKRAEAVQLAKGKLDELAVTNGWNTGQTQGDFGLDKPGYLWSASAQSWTGGASGNNGGMTELDVTVTWTSKSAQRSVMVSTLVNANPGGN